LAIGLHIGNFMIFSPNPSMESSRLFAEDAVLIVDEVSVAVLKPNELAQLLQRPGRRRMSRDIEM
jgi:hypothetical protein